MKFKLEDAVIQEVLLPPEFGSIQLFVKREDRIHEHVSGNKYRKLLYNLKAAKDGGFDTLLTFGGAFSNHIAAVAAAGQAEGFKTIGVIRGEELTYKVADNPTLKFAKECGMQFQFVTREDYRYKTSPEFIQQLETRFGSFYLVPEGGTNGFAVKGCEEILKDVQDDFDYICCAVGTGGTISGLVNGSTSAQKILGFPALKGGFLSKDISKFARNTNWSLIEDYHFGGYAKINEDLISFINQFKKEYQIPLDPVYTGKMMYGILDLIKKGYFPEQSKILAIHTGGLQGIAGMNINLKRKQLPIID
ncbi:1-aminocyclopropane-1-carboxylate deaminase/D-cysteine desulfhydrase [Mangrovimonas sp. DI 80]|uniref:1-aminocyclopropane-1-carboxylate deaminase/D-cysteine desulfhydrase n=1 Tax=Mangrovimonas sp. DI 80 TaxID=1779330 RepID=UPI0009F88495|nr:pyridoxal-phosphate dependent enzyme [Mangrovimonas sp. DI 80]